MKILQRTVLTLIAITGVWHSTNAEPTLVTFPDKEIMNQTGGPNITGISRNGRYAWGVNYIQGGMIYDTTGDSIISISGSYVSDNGLALIGLSTVNVHTGEVTRFKMGGGNYSFCMTTAISADGKIAVGMGGPTWTELKPLYWENGEMHTLPYPTTEEVKTFKVNGCEVRQISGDGSVIVGRMVCNPNTYPMIIWLRQEDGSYQYIDTWSDLYEPLHGWAYNEETKEDYVIKGPNPWMRMEPGQITADGKTISMYIQDNASDKAVPPMQLGFYHVDTRELEVLPLDKSDMFGQAETFILTGISNDLTVVGITGSLLIEPTPFIKYYDSKPQYLNDAFPTLDELEIFTDYMLDGLPYLLTGISEDGRFLCGYCTHTFLYNRGTPVEDEDLAFTGFIIDTEGNSDDPNGEGNEDSGVEEIVTETDMPAEYYTLQGIRIERPDKGIFIEMRGSKIRKVVL